MMNRAVSVLLSSQPNSGPMGQNEL